MVDSITELFQYCFQSSRLSSIKLSSSLSSLSAYCFRWSSIVNVTNVESIQSLGVAAFYEATSLERVELGNKLTLISSFCFLGCTKLSYCPLPDSLLTISNSAFYGCSSFKDIQIPINVSKWGTGAFGGINGINITIDKRNNNFQVDEYGIVYNSLNTTIAHVPSDLVRATLREQLPSIGENCFAKISSLSTIILGSKLSSIGSSAFNGCSNLANITFPMSLLKIDNSAFSSCSSLKTVQLPPRINSIGAYAFSGTGVSNLTFPASVASIGTGAASSCKNLVEVIVLGSPSFGEAPFSKCPKFQRLLLGCQIIASLLYKDFLELKNVLFLIGVKTIESGAFLGDSNLVNVEFQEPSHLTTISPMAFSKCTSLTTITLPASLTSVTASSFSGCTKLSSIFIKESSNATFETFNKGVYSNNRTVFVLCPPALNLIEIEGSVKMLGNQAFYDCRYLKEVALGEQLDEISTECFYGCNEIVSITIPTKIKKIGERAFGSCAKLKVIIYCGISDKNINFTSNPFETNAIVYVNSDYGPGNTFCDKSVIKSKSRNPLGCPNIPSKTFSISKKKQKIRILRKIITLIVRTTVIAIHSYQDAI